MDKQQQVADLKRKGLSIRKIAETVGIARSEVSKHLKEAGLTQPIKPRVDRLNREAVLGFLESKTHVEPPWSGYGPANHVFIGGIVPSESFLRAINRWKAEEDYPTMQTLDRWLTTLEIPYSLYEDWCEQKGLSPWAHSTDQQTAS